MNSNERNTKSNTSAAGIRAGDLPLPQQSSNSVATPTNAAAATPQQNSNVVRRTDSANASKLNTPLVRSRYEKPDPVGKREMPSWIREVGGLLAFVVVVLFGAWLINHFVFQSFNVVGPSMEPTLEGEGGTNDRLIVNRLPVTAAALAGQDYVPSRGDIIVFKNPLHDSTDGSSDEYIVKRVIAFAGERVTVDNCTLLVYNDEHPNGYNPYPTFDNLADNDEEVNTCVDGSGTDITVPDGEIFVTGDHRVGSYSMDSRDGGGKRATLGTIPLNDIVGPVAMRIWPLNKITLF